MALTPLQDAFCHEYLIDHNGTQAAIRAGASARAANRTASRWLSNVVIQERICELTAEQQERVALSADYVVKGLMKEASERGEGASHAARVSALSWLGKHLEMFTERVKAEVGVEVEIAEIVVRTRAEAKAALSAVAEAIGVPRQLGISEGVRGGTGSGEEQGGSV